VHYVIGEPYVDVMDRSCLEECPLRGMSGRLHIQRVPDTLYSSRRVYCLRCLLRGGPIGCDPFHRRALLGMGTLRHRSQGSVRTHRLTRWSGTCMCAN
jgi:hypothetical protein